MKKQIDPNLDSSISDDFLDNLEKETPKQIAKDEDEGFVVLQTDKNKSDGSATPITLEPKENSDHEMNLETVDKQHSHHHSSSSHHSSGEHSSSGEHHSSSEHSSSSHHHSSGEHSSSSHHHSSSSHHSSSKKEKKKLSIPVKIAIAVLIIILLIILLVVGIVAYLEIQGKNDFKSTDTETQYEETIEYNGHTYTYNDDVVAIAFLGIDKRELGLEDDLIGTAGQSDADIVLTVDTSTGEATAIAIPRDTMVDVDLYSSSGIFLRTETLQLCLSYAYGDGKETSATNVMTSISRILYNVPINKYFALDLDGIEPINDAIGGVTLESLYDFPSLGISKGDTIHLEGDLTETYVRTRSLDTVDASLNRTERQVQYIKAFAAQVVPAIMEDFSIVSSLYNTASDYSTTNLSLSNITYLGSLLISKGVTDFETITLEGEMKESDSVDYADYVYAEFYPDEDKLLQVVLDVFYTQVD
ncbi:MAG: LCP family protein [Clostridiales bacterium]|nr:LCP family protein [Clostridiales bacterium]